jgi:hypothetical protein
MDMKRIIIGMIAGAVTLQVVGYLVFEVLTAEFYAANSMSGLFRDATLQWAVAVGNVSLAALITLGVLSRPGTPTIGGGFVVGAIIGLLLWIGVDFVLYGIWNAQNLMLTVVDPLLGAAVYGVAGAAAAAALARVPKGAAI